MKTVKIILTLLATSLIASPSLSQIKLSGYFIAREKCPAYQSFRKKTNPGNIMTDVDTAYDLIAKNKPAASHYLIRTTAQPNNRWVAVSCGEHVVPVDAIVQPFKPIDDQTNPPEASRYILAISWQPGFCETRPNKPECQSQTESRFDASHFTLHGLWPQPRKNIYCLVHPAEVAKDKNKKWRELQELTLENATRDELNMVMPGTQSFLHRHEWIKHGTCYNGETPETYYRDSLKLMREINDNTSAFRNLFADNIGAEITSTQIIDAFEDSFGDGTGRKIKITCKRDDNRLLITEITIGLQGDLGEISMSEALLAAPNANNIGCSKGVVDPVGLQ